MRREIVFIWLALALGVAVVVYSALAQIQMPVEGQDTHSELVGQLVGGETAGQTFLARYNHLYRIDLFMSTYARPNTQPIVFHLKKAPDAPDEIFQLSFNAGEVKDYAYHSFTFPPVPDSAGQTYYFYLESPSSVEGDALSIWLQPHDLYPQGTMFRNGVPAIGDLRFQAYYQGSYKDKVAALLDRLVANKPSIWGEKWLYILLGTATAGMTIYFLFQTARTLFEDEGDQGERL
jgi:hypothetical protein